MKLDFVMTFGLPIGLTWKQLNYVWRLQIYNGMNTDNKLEKKKVYLLDIACSMVLFKWTKECKCCIGKIPFPKFKCGPLPTLVWPCLCPFLGSYCSWDNMFHGEIWSKSNMCLIFPYLMYIQFFTMLLGHWSVL